MILTRKITRSFDIYQEVVVDEQLLDNFEELGEIFDMEDLIHSYDESEYARVWEVIEDIHSAYGDTIFEEKQYMPDQSYDDVCEYSITDKSYLLEREPAV
jgi:hypothetical protein